MPGVFAWEGTEADFFSSDKQWRFHVKPGVGPGYPEPIAAKRRAGLDTGPEGPLFYLYAEGELFKRENNESWSTLWKRRLHNPYAPMRVLVPRDGSYVVTLGDVQDMLRPFSPNDVVVYGPKGGLVERIDLKKLAPDLSPSPGHPPWTWERRADLPYPCAPWAAAAILDEQKKLLALDTLNTSAARTLTIAIKGEELPYAPFRSSAFDDSLKSDEEVYAEVNRSQNLAEQQSNILRLLRNPHPVWKRSALAFLQQLYIPAAAPELMQMFSDPDPDLVRLAGYVLKRCPVQEREHLTLRLFQHPNPQVRANAVLESKNFPTAPLLVALNQLASDTNYSVRLAVARRGIPDGYSVDRSLARPLLNKLRHDKDGGVRLFADSAMTALNEQTLKPWVEQLKQPVPDLPMRGVLNNLFQELLKDPETAHDVIAEHEDLILSWVMRTGNEMTSYEAVRLLSLSLSPKAREVISRAAREHPSREVRDNAKLTLERAEIPK